MSENRILKAIPLALLLASCAPQTIDLAAQQAWQQSVDAKKPGITILNNPPTIVNDKLVDVVPVSYSVDESSTDTTVTVDGKKPISLPNFDGPGKTALVNVGTEGAHVLQITAKHCETSSEFGYYCSPESIYTATIISDFTPAGAVVESITTLPDGRMQVNYALSDTNANLGGTITYGNSVTSFDANGKSSLIFDFREKNINQVKVQVCDAVANCQTESVVDTLHDTTPPQLLLLSETVVEGNRVLTFQLQDNWQNLLPFGGKITVGNQTVGIPDESGIVTIRQDKVDVGESVISSTGVDVAGNPAIQENKFTYNPFPTSVEMIQEGQDGTLRFRLHVDTTRKNFDPNLVTIHAEQDANPSILNSFPLLKHVLCSDPEVDTQTIDITCKPLIPSGHFQYTLTGEAAGGQSWKATETFSIDTPQASAEAQLWYVLMTGMAYATAVASTAAVGTAVARRFEESKRKKRVEEFEDQVILRGQPLGGFLKRHDEPNVLDIAVNEVRKMGEKKKRTKETIPHRLAQSERNAYAQIERMWTYEYRRGDIYGALLKARSIDTRGYPSLEKLKYDIIGVLCNKINEEFEEIVQNRYVQAIGSHRIKMYRGFIHGFSKEREFKKLRSDIREKLVTVTDTFDLVLRARSMAGRDFVTAEHLDEASVTPARVANIYYTLLDWNNFSVAHEMRKLKKIAHLRGMMDEKYKKSLDNVRSQFLFDLSSSDVSDITTKKGRVKILKRYVEDMKLPHGLIQEFISLIDLEEARRAHDYVKMMMSFDTLVKNDSTLPMDETFRATVGDALQMIRMDLEPYYASHSVARMTKDAMKKLVQFDLQLQKLKKTNWWDAIRSEHKDVVEMRVGELSIVLGANTVGFLQNKYKQMFDDGNEVEIFGLIRTISSWRNFYGVDQLLSSIGNSDTLLRNSLSRSFIETFWSPYVAGIIESLKSGNMSEVQDMYEKSTFNMAQGIEIKSLITNYNEYSIWKTTQLPHWAHLDLFPYPEQTMAGISKQVEALIIENRLNFTDALSVVGRWYEFKSLNAKPVAIFHYLDIPLDEIQKSLQSGDLAPLAKTMRLKLFNLTARMQQILASPTGDMEVQMAYYRLIGDGLQNYWTKPLIEWMRQVAEPPNGIIKTKQIKERTIVMQHEPKDRAIDAINNVFASLLALGRDGYYQTITSSGVQSINSFVGGY